MSVEAEYTIFLGDDYNDGAARARAENFVAAAEVHAHPEWDRNRNLNDIGVVITDSPIPREAAPINRANLTPSDIGETIRIIGFGQTSAEDKTVGRRHSAASSIAAIDATGLAMRGTPNICLYDSGGPTFMKRGNTDALVGIHSLSDSATCDGQGVDTRIDPYVEFIDGYITKFDSPPHDGGTLETDSGMQADSSANAAPPDDAPAATSSSCSLGRRRSPTGLSAVALLVGATLVLGRFRRPSHLAR